MLARFDLVGIDVGGRWQVVAEHLVARARDTVQPFLTLQFLYGLIKARRPEAYTLMDAVRAFAKKAPHFSREVWSEVALPVCEGLLAHAKGNYDRAWHELSTALPRLAEVGGSHAQRDLFEQILLDAAINSGRLSAAQQMLEVRRSAEPDSVPVNAALASVYSRLGLESLAAQAQTRADSVRARHSKSVQA